VNELVLFAGAGGGIIEMERKMDIKRAIKLFEQINPGIDLAYKKNEDGYEDEFINILFHGFLQGLNQHPQIYAVSSLAKKTGVSESRIHKLAEARMIGQKVGGTWIFSDNDINIVLSRKGKRGRPKKENES
jgi:hypothetical protein